jgi:Asp-tRNA(Asn)/Glu-tRNA(Gln) amidotransferase A subunit family amidase
MAGNERTEDALSEAEYWRFGLAAAADAITGGTLTARALAEGLLARVAATDAAIDAWAHIDPQYVRAEADRCDAQDASKRGPLFGVGIGVKDIIATADQPTQMGSPVYAGNRRDADAECVVRLKLAGGFVFGKTVTTELAYMQPGKTKNPWNARHTPGGSSSGSAAAVAAGQISGAIGTQTNGSVIRPAAYCGVIGFKPTKDAIPFAGVHVFSETLDQLGTFTRNVADAARLANALANAGLIAQRPAAVVKPPRLAYIDGFPWTSDVDCDADDTLDAAATRLRQHGAMIVPVNFPGSWRDAHLVHRTIMLFEAASHHAGLQDRERSQLSLKLNAGLDEGRAISSADYRAALAKRTAAIAAFTEWIADYDAIVAPSAPGPAPAGLDSTGDPSCCTLWSLLGFPAITLPMAFAPDGLPLGMQLAAPLGRDDALLAVAAWCEARLPFKGLI